MQVATGRYLAMCLPADSGQVCSLALTNFRSSDPSELSHMALS